MDKFKAWYECTQYPDTYILFPIHPCELFFKNQSTLWMLNLKLKFMKLTIYLSNQCSEASDWDIWCISFQNSYFNYHMHYQLTDVSQTRYHHTIFMFGELQLLSDVSRISIDLIKKCKFLNNRVINCTFISYVVQAGIKLIIFFLQPPKHLYYRAVTLCLYIVCQLFSWTVGRVNFILPTIGS